MADTLSENLESKVDSSDIKRRPTNEELSKLYPSPKTYDEKLNDRKVIQAKIFAKQPRHIATYSAIRLFIVILLAGVIINTAPQIVMWNVISGVFGIALLALFWLGIVAWQYSEISSVLYKKEISVGSFFGFYLLLIASPMIIGCYIVNEHVRDYSLVVMYGLLFLIHLLCVYLLLKFLSRKR